VTGQTLAAFEPLLPAERVIVAELRSGDFDRLGDGTRPEGPAEDRVVRAQFLRFLLLGGEGEVRLHEKGVRVSGGFISGALDLEGCRVPRDIGLKDCRFDAPVLLRSAVIDNLFLDGSAVPGIDADRLEARGGVTLRGADIAGTLSLAGATLGGELSCDGATLRLPRETVLAAPGLRASAVLLRGTTVEGGLDLQGARLEAGVEGQGLTIEQPEGIALNAASLEAGGNVSLRLATISGTVRLSGAAIEGDLDCRGATLSASTGDALDLGRAQVQGGFLLRDGASVTGVLDLTGAGIGTLHDDYPAWPGPGDLLLNRCIYGAFIDGPVDARGRIDWLSRQTPGRWKEDFWPQPYEQLASVFREMGHEEDARRVLMEKERLQRAARRARTRRPLWRFALAAKDAVLGVTLGYGRQPLLAFVWLFLFWLVGVGVFAHADTVGSLKPNSAVVLRSAEWTGCRMPQGTSVELPGGATVPGRARPGQPQLHCYREQFEALSYPEFNAWMFSLDALFPVFEIGQRDFWRPDPAQPFGGVTITYFYLESVVGWALSLLAVAGFSGLVKSR
jgi:hypothetical protein